MNISIFWCTNCNLKVVKESDKKKGSVFTILIASVSKNVITRKADIKGGVQFKKKKNNKGEEEEEEEEKHKLRTIE